MKRFLSLILCVLMVLPVIASCGGNASGSLDELPQDFNNVTTSAETEETTEETTAETTAAPEATEETTVETTSASETTEETTTEPVEVGIKLFGAEAEKLLYTIIRDNNASGTLKNKINSLKELLTTSTDKKVDYKACNALIDRSPDNQDFEILIGNTLRTASIEATQNMQPKDYFVGVVGNKIVIVGGSDAATCEALDYFVELITEQLEGAKGQTEFYLDLGEPYTYTHVYKARGMKIGGVTVDNFRIRYMTGDVLDDSAVAASAKKLNDTICNYSGVDIGYKVITANDGVQANEILMGTVAKGYAAEYYVTNYKPLDYSVKMVDGKLYICGGSEWAIDYAVDYLIDKFFKVGLPIKADYETSGSLFGKLLYQYEDGANLRIMANNVWSNNNNNDVWAALGEDCSTQARTPGFIACYLAFQPDVILFQEMNKTMLNLMKTQFKNAGFTYQETESVNGANVVYNTATLKLINHGRKQYDDYSGPSKAYAWALFEHKATGKRFIAVSTHLWWKSESDDPGSDARREAQATEAAKKCVALAKQYNCPVFLGGDFNARTSAKSMQNILAEGMLNCYGNAKKYDNLGSHHMCGPEGFGRGSAGTNDQAIDHMFYYNLGNSTLNSFRRTQPYFFIKLSDHYPLYVDVTLR